ncbi:MAG: 5-(carboxyamino)imidazole ribonucleotide synthase [Candidatus Binatia bacterium]
MTRVGLLRGGQLGRLLALAGQPLGLRFRVFDPEPDCPAAGLGEHVQARFDDEEALDRFADGLDVVTCEIEGIPADALARLAARVPVRPQPEALALKQDRLLEKRWLHGLGLRTARFAPAECEADLAAALAITGFPAVVKRRSRGYDGRGQVVVRAADAAAAAWATLGGEPLLVEQGVEFARELALIAVRGLDGEMRAYPLTESFHQDGILCSALAPAPQLGDGVQDAAEVIARQLLLALDYVGVLAVELFALRSGELLVNEIAPRVHNTGHWTIEGAETSQFENHLRAICGLPLGATAAVGSSFLANVIGAPPDLPALLRVPDTHVHLYGKASRPGRKIGHVTARAQSTPELRLRGEAVGRLLSTTNRYGRIS